MIRPMPSWDNCVEIAKTIIRIHTDRGPCIFTPDAVENMARAAWNAANSRYGSEQSVVDAMVMATLENEIYCPHEGVDRRSEYGLPC